MDLVRNLISLGRNVREENKVKVRQPISEVVLDGKNKEILNDLVDLIKEELNVKNVVFENDLSKYMNYFVKPNFKEVGKIFGSNIKEFANKLESLSTEDILKLENNETISMVISGDNYDVNKDMFDLRISSKEGFNVGSLNNNFVILNTTLTEDLVLEGLARECVSKVQQLRKNNDFNIVDRINLYYSSDEEFDKCVSKFESYIKDETLALTITKSDSLTDSYDLNGHDVKLKVEKAS